MAKKLKATPVVSEVEEKEEQDSGYGEYEKYEIEGAARTLMEAEAIKSDANKMKYVKQCMQKQCNEMKGAISSMDELKEVAKKKMMEEDED